MKHFTCAGRIQLGARMTVGVILLTNQAHICFSFFLKSVSIFHLQMTELDYDPEQESAS